MCCCCKDKSNDLNTSADFPIAAKSIDQKLDVIIELIRKLINKELCTDMQIDQVIDLLREI